jgi:hypothetical protein
MVNQKGQFWCQYCGRGLFSPFMFPSTKLICFARDRTPPMLYWSSLHHLPLFDAVSSVTLLVTLLLYGPDRLLSYGEEIRSSKPNLTNYTTLSRRLFWNWWTWRTSSGVNIADGVYSFQNSVDDTLTKKFRLRLTSPTTQHFNRAYLFVRRSHTSPSSTWITPFNVVSVREHSSRALRFPHIIHLLYVAWPLAVLQDEPYLLKSIKITASTSILSATLHNSIWGLFSEKHFKLSKLLRFRQRSRTLELRGDLHVFMCRWYA